MSEFTKPPGSCEFCGFSFRKNQERASKFGSILGRGQGLVNNCSAAAGRAPNWTGHTLNNFYFRRGSCRNQNGAHWKPPWPDNSVSFAKQYPEIRNRTKQILSNPPKDSIEPLERFNLTPKGSIKPPFDP